MTNLQVPVNALVLELDQGLRLGIVPQVPGASYLARSRSGLIGALRSRVERSLECVPPLQFHRVAATEAVQVRELVARLEAPDRETNWRDPLDFPFLAATWPTDSGWVGYVPLLGLWSVASEEDELLARLDYLLVGELRRICGQTMVAGWSLPAAQSLHTQRMELTSTVSSPKQIRIKAGEAAPTCRLQDFCERLRASTQPVASFRDDLLEQLTTTLGGTQPTSVLLVGDSGVGKSAIVNEFIRAHAARELPFTSYWRTSGATIVAGMSGYGMWQERCDRMIRELQEQRGLLVLGNLFELMEVGQSQSSTQGIGDYLRPAIAQRKIACIAECTQPELDEIQRRNPRMIDAFQRISVESLESESTRALLRQIADRRAPTSAKVADAVIEACMKLHDRYATYSPRPGRIVRFFRYLLEDGEREETHPLDASAVAEAFARQTGMPRQMLDDALSLDVEQLRDEFRRQIIGQDQAIEQMLDTLAGIKAVLNRPGRPIASFLLIGPTGVGKTEMAKTITRYLYGSSDRMTRIDMSEFGDGLAAERLAGASWQKEGILTARVREQPFGVVLLDEFEKAHPDVFDLLLQILGEGKLTDSVGRVADFSNTVVMMTSNLGAEGSQRPDLGFQTNGAADARLHEHYLREVRRFLRPEIYNRIDRIVPFAPLSRESVRQIVAKQLTELQVRIAERANGTLLACDPAVVDHLATAGFDPAMGARPVRRKIEQLLLAPIADAWNADPKKRDRVCRVDVKRRQIRVKLAARDKVAPGAVATVVAHDESTSMQGDASSQETSPSQESAPRQDAAILVDYLRRAARLRRGAERLEYHDIVSSERSRYTVLQRELSQKRSVRKPDVLQAVENERARIEAYLRRFSDVSTDAFALEERLLLDSFGSDAILAPDLEAQFKELTNRHQDNLVDTYAKSNPCAEVGLMLIGESTEFLATLLDAYQNTCAQLNMPTRLYRVFHHRGLKLPLPIDAVPMWSGNGPNRWEIQKLTLKDVEYAVVPESRPQGATLETHEWLESQRGSCLVISDPRALSVFEDEPGTHEFVPHAGTYRAHVTLYQGSLDRCRASLYSDVQRELQKRSPTRWYDINRMPRLDELKQLLPSDIIQGRIRRAERWIDSVEEE